MMEEAAFLNLDAWMPGAWTMEDGLTLLVALVAFGCSWALLGSFTPVDHFSKQIVHIQARRDELRDAFSQAKKRKKHERPVTLMRWVAMKLQLVKKHHIGHTQTELVQAGLRSKDAIYVLAFFNVLAPLLLCAIGIVIMQWNDDVAPRWRVMNYLWPVLGAYLGLKLPMYWVRRKKRERGLHIQRSLPDVLDLMTICAEAGLSMVAMLERVSREIRMTYPEMAEELSLTAIEIGFLPERSRALIHLAERCDLAEVRGMTSVLIQTERYGTPIAQALRVISSEFRQARMMRAEQKAGRLPALMTVPMIVFILPTLFIVIIAPAVVKLMQ